MKKTTKTTFPDCANSTSIVISQNEQNNSKSPVWSDYMWNNGDMLTLRVTVELAGGGTCFLDRFESEEAERAADLEQNRCEAWRNAVKFAEQLWAACPYKEYVVSLRLYDKNIGQEAVCVYQRFRR